MYRILLLCAILFFCLLVYFLFYGIHAAWKRFLYFTFEEQGPQFSVVFPWLIKTDERVQKICCEVCEAATKEGFKFRYPRRITITKPWVRPLSFAGVAYPNNYSDESEVVICGYLADTLSDSQLSALIAHEIGHIVDSQTNRKGHHFFIPEIVALDKETFAWAFALLITSSETVNDYRMWKYQQSKLYL